jgi:hypothetical protein
LPEYNAMTDRPNPSRPTRRSHNGDPPDRLDWLNQMHEWRSDHRRALAKLVRIEAMLLHLDADLDESLQELLAGSDPLDTDAEASLIEALDTATAQQAAAIETFDTLIKRLEKLQGEIAAVAPTASQEVVKGVTEKPDLDDEVDEAAWESFPASDPPSFNPGRA